VIFKNLKLKKFRSAMFILRKRTLGNHHGGAKGSRLPIGHKAVSCFLADVITTWRSHVPVVLLVFQQLFNVGLKLNAEKICR
jgi:hypothetical protein